MFSMKMKTLIGLGTGLLGTAAIVTPLCCSCSTTNNYDENDRIYNVGERQLQHVEGQYHSVVKTKVEKDGQHAGKTPEEIAKLVKDADERVTAQLVNFREQKEKQNASFTQITDAIIEKANMDWNVQLSRNLDPSINWSNENIKIQKQYSNLLRDYMNKDGVLTRDQISAQLKSFETKFSALSVKLGAEYADPLKAQNELKAQIATCFDEINNKTALTAAASILKDFFRKFSFELKTSDNNSQPIYWDYLKDNKDTEFKGVFDVSPTGAENTKFTQWVNQNFVCVDTKTKAQIGFNFLDQTHPLIPDYRIIPIFKGFVEEALTNNHSILIDWAFIKNKHYDKKDPNLSLQVTAHSFSLKNSNNLKKDIDYVNDMVKLPDSEKEFNKYPLPVSVKYEKNEIKTEYLDNLIFRWAPKEECHYEEFFCAAGDDYSGDLRVVSLNQLCKIGLQVASKEHPDDFWSLSDAIWFAKTIPEHHWQLFHHFVKNCDLVSILTFVDDPLHDIGNHLYASYLNSSHSPSISAESNKWQALEGNDKNWYRATGFPISRELWISAKNDFNSAQNFVDALRNNNAFNLGLTAGIVIEAAMVTFFMIQLGFFIKGIVTMLDNPPLFTIQAVSLGVAFVSCFLVGFLVVNPIRQYKNDMEDVWKTNEFKIISEMVKNDEDYFKSEEKFRMLPWVTVRKLISKYKNFKDTPEVKNITKKFDSILNPETYKKKVESKFIKYVAVDFALAMLNVGLLIAMFVVMFKTAEATATQASANATKTKIEDDRVFFLSNLDTATKGYKRTSGRMISDMFRIYNPVLELPPTSKA